MNLCDRQILGDCVVGEILHNESQLINIICSITKTFLLAFLLFCSVDTLHGIQLSKVIILDSNGSTFYLNNINVHYHLMMNFSKNSGVVKIFINK